MKNYFRGIVLAFLSTLFIGIVAWAYLGTPEDISGRSSNNWFYPGAYPSQFLPMLANIPAPTPTPKPPATLHVGLELRWDGQGHILNDDYYWNPGLHEQIEIDRQVDPDTVRASGNQWYSPNPFNWQSEDWYCHYNNVTNRTESCSEVSDPEWKWRYPWIFPSDINLESGKTVKIDGQVFTVSGPHTFITGYGEEARFWRLVNRDRFLYHFNGTEWKQYVELGDAVLFYGYDNRRFLLFSNIKRTYYKNDNQTSDSVRYEKRLNQLEGILNVAADLRDTASPTYYDTTTEELDYDDYVKFLNDTGIDEASILNGP